MLYDRATCLENHERFVQRVAESETVWGLDSGDGFAWCESNEEDDREVILFWSDRAYAERALRAQFSDCQPDSIRLFDYLFRWLPGMAGDGVYAGTNWTGDLAGIEVDPEELRDQITARMGQDMIERYRDELKASIDEQNQSE